MPPQTRYARSGEVNIAYQVVGDGPLDLVFVPGFISHLDLQWADPRIARFLEKLASFSRLIMFDKRGTGLSDPVAAPAPLEDRMDDVRAVMDAAGSERAAVLGLSEDGPMSVLFAATYPERTRALILCGTFATGTDDPDENPGGQRWVDAIGRARATAEHWGEGRTLALFAPSVDSESDRIGRGIFERSAASPNMAQTLLGMAVDTDVCDLLTSLRVPALVLHRARISSWARGYRSATAAPASLRAFLASGACLPSNKSTHRSAASSCQIHASGYPPSRAPKNASLSAFHGPA
jgi:pimeloyl-ACP methyl ester carboxylesterase